MFVLVLVLVLVRHAGNKSRWHGRNGDRLLNTFGYRQARGLVAALDCIELRALFASPTTRCNQSILPLAALHGSTPIGQCSAPTGRSSTR